MERQSHGFSFEKYLENKYNIVLSTSYTAKWDGVYNNHPISIKTAKKGNAIDLGDIFRQANISEDFYLIVNFYTATENDIHFLYIPWQEWKKYFMELSIFEPIFRDALETVSNDRKDDKKWRQLMTDCKTLWKQNTPNIVRPNGKRDHKSQKRWQCSICNSLFIKEILPKYEISEDEFIGKYNKK